MKGKIGKYKGIIFDLDGTLLDTIEDLGDSMNKLLTIDYADEILFLNIDIKNLLEILYHDEYNEYFGFSEAQLKNPSEDDMVGINSRIQPFFCRTTKNN